jgi:hypothetical protein
LIKCIVLWWIVLVLVLVPSFVPLHNAPRTSFGIVVVVYGLALPFGNVAGIVGNVLVALACSLRRPCCLGALFLLLLVALQIVARTFSGIVVADVVLASHIVSGTPHIAVLVPIDPHRRPPALSVFPTPSIVPRSAADTVVVASIRVLPTANTLGTTGTPSEGAQGHGRLFVSARSASCMKDNGTCQRYPFHTGSGKAPAHTSAPHESHELKKETPRLGKEPKGIETKESHL